MSQIRRGSRILDPGVAQQLQGGGPFARIERQASPYERSRSRDVLLFHYFVIAETRLHRARNELVHAEKIAFEPAFKRKSQSSDSQDDAPMTRLVRRRTCF